MTKDEAIRILTDAWYLFGPTARSEASEASEASEVRLLPHDHFVMGVIESGEIVYVYSSGQKLYGCLDKIQTPDINT